MVIEARRTLVWGTAAGAVVSAALLAVSGGGPRVAGLGGDLSRARPVATAPVDGATPAAVPERAGAAPFTPVH